MIDLHTHSNASDGSVPPGLLASLGREAGLSWMALTDHNTTGGLPAFLRAAQGAGLRPIAGAEITCEHGGRELHMLALDLPESSFSQLQTFLEDVVARARESRQQLVLDLAKAGYPLRYEEIARAHPGSLINRMHIALALKDAGLVPSVKAAFDTLLSEQAGYYHPARRLQAADVIPMIRDLGAVPVWAQPFLKLDGSQVGGILEDLVPRGLSAMEVYYTTYTPAQTQAALALAEKYRIKPSGGSDFHGTSKPGVALGVGRGNLNIPDAVAEALFDR